MANTNEYSSESKKAGKKKWVFISLGLLAAGALSYFGINYFKKNKKENSTDEAPDFKVNKTQSSVKKTNPKAATPKNITASSKSTQKKVESKIQISVFPLRKGSRGSEVKAVQLALIKKHGKNILPKSGADGIFGNEMILALRKLKLPESISQTQYNVLVEAKKYDPKQVATLLNTAANKKEFNRIIVLLKTIPNTKVYTQVNTFFLNLFTRGVRQTLVTGLLNTFSDKNQKQAIQQEFVRIGLKYNGAKWSLAGNETNPLIITTQQTKVWKDPKTSVSVPINMVLGKEITKRGKFTLFENDRTFFLVETQHISNYQTKTN